MNRSAADIPVETLASLPWYTEGPAIDKAGNIFFTTMKGGRILRIDPAGTLSEWALAGCPNGQLVLPDGDHLVCDSALHTVSRFDPQGKLIRHEIKGTCAGQLVLSPNDLTTDRAGGVYFTDSVRRSGRVFYYDRGGREHVVAENLDFPNGIALSNDGQWLYVAESYCNRILVVRTGVYPLRENTPKVFANLPLHASGNIIDNLPDGIRVDEQGRLLVAHYGMGCVQVLSAHGQWLQSMPTGFALTSNLAVTDNAIIVTGGHAEPGPGGVIRVPL